MVKGGNLLSKLYKNYVLLKINNSQTHYLFKCGFFYVFIDEDAKLMSKILNIKLSNLTENIVKCGFPSNSLDKYMNTLHSLGYDVAIVNSKTNSISNFDSYSSDIKIEDFLHKISNIDAENLSISQAYSLLSQIKDEAREILNKE